MDVDDYNPVESPNPSPFWQNGSAEDSFAEILGSDPDKTAISNPVVTTIPFLPLGLAIIIVTVFGIVGNSLSAVVLSRKRLESSYSVLTLALTFVDSVYLITKLLRYGLASFFVHLSIARNYTHIGLPIVGPYLRAITFTAHTASTYLTIAIAVDRYIAICQPSLGRKFCTRKRARISVLAVILWSIIFNATRWLEFTTVKIENVANSSNESAYYAMQITELRLDATYKEVYIFWVYFIVMFLGPFVSLSILNICIYFGIRKLMRSSTGLTSIQKRDTSFSLMLIGVVVVFLICNVDYLVLDILEYCGVKYHEFWNYLGNFLLTLNSSVNFLIYCAFGWKFRQELWEIIKNLCLCKRRRGSHDIVMSDDCQWVKDTINMDVRAIPRVSLSKAGKSTSY